MPKGTKNPYHKPVPLSQSGSSRGQPATKTATALWPQPPPPVPQTTGPPDEFLERGTIFDYTVGDFVFPFIPGLTTADGLVYDWREPTVAQLREMLDNDGKARSLELALTMPIIAAGWRISPGTGNDDHETAMWVEEILRKDSISGGMKTSMETVISQMTSAFINRRSYHEKVWKVGTTNTWVYDKIAWRPPASCTVIRKRNHGTLDGFLQRTFYDASGIPILRPYALVYVHGQNETPARGMSELTVAYRNFRIKEKLKYLWYTYCEVMSLPRTVVLAKSDSAAKKAAAAIAALKTAGVAGIPQEWISKIEPLPVAATGSQEFQQAIAYLDSDSSMSLLANWITLPARATGTGAGMASNTGARGSFGLMEAAQDFYIKMLTAYATELATCITNEIVADLVRLNLGPRVQIPRFEIGDIQLENYANIFVMLNALATSQSLNVPIEFLQELTLTVANQFGMNTDTIGRAFAQMVKDSPPQQFYATAAVAAQLSDKVKTAVQGNGSHPAPVTGDGA
jgi:hypothetical protein